MGEKTPNIEGSSPKKCPRPYRLGQRETGMEETRVRVIAAARELILAESALADFTINTVAQKAGITRTTVYHRFGSKQGLLEALFDDIGMRGRLSERLPDALTRPDPLEGLRAYIEVFCDFWENDRMLNRRLRGFAALDKEFAVAIASRNERRNRGIEMLLDRLSSLATFSPLPPRENLVPTLLALTSFEFYDALAGERPPAEVAPILFRLTLAALTPTP